MRVELDITPVGKPRMTQRDKWAHRPVIDAYYAFKDDLNLKARAQKFALPDRFSVTFYLPMPKSWSAKKREDKNLAPHDAKPDLDNLVKALCDCLRSDDSTIWNVAAAKLWGEKGGITITTYEEN